jgi:large subunit ribosomal protein L24
MGKMNKWIRRGDQVVVLAGNDKGRTGEVLSRRGDRVVIQGVNVRKKHMRRTQQAQAGGIVDIETSIHVSNVAICDKEGKRIKLFAKVSEKGKKELVYRSGEKEVVYRAANKSA